MLLTFQQLQYRHRQHTKKPNTEVQMGNAKEDDGGVGGGVYRS